MNNLIITYLVVTLIFLSSAIGESSKNQPRGVQIDGGLTDQEQNFVDNYQHLGLAKQIFQEECNKSGNRDACKNEKAYAFSEETDSKIDLIATFYGYYSMVSASNSKIKMPAQASAKAKEKAWQSDNCQWIPGGVAVINQQMMQGYVDFRHNNAADINQATGDVQRESIEELKMAHKKREKAAIIEAGGWGATAACYVFALSSGGLPSSRGTWLKMGAAVALSTYNFKKAQKQRKYQKILDKILKKMPKKGDCNPISERYCYCNQPSTANDKKYCWPKIMADRKRRAEEIVSCVDNALRADPACRCLDSDTCFDKTFRDLTARGRFDTASANSIFKGVGPVYRGGFQEGELSNIAGKQLAFAKKILKKEQGKLRKKIGTKPISSSQLDNAKYLTELGLPSLFAKHFATMPMNSKAKLQASKMKSDRNKVRNSILNFAGKHRKKGSEVTYTSGKGLDLSSKSKKKNTRVNPYLRRKKGSKNKSFGEVIDFANRAYRRAQIHSAHNKLFDIISHRYKMNVWRKR